METNDEIKARVNAGARWLEEQFGPEWIDKIDLDTLDLACWLNCIGGQLYDDNYDGMIKALPEIDDRAGYAFTTWDNVHASDLTQAWTKKILKLRKAR